MERFRAFALRVGAMASRFYLRRFDVLVMSAVQLPVFLGASIYNRLHVPLMSPDSAGYIGFAYDRPFAYPLFVNAIKLLVGTYSAVAPIQLAVLLVAVVVLTLAFRRYVGTLWVAVLLECTLVANPGLLMFSGEIMSEALSAACTAIFAAGVLEMSAGHRSRGFFPLAAAVAIAIGLRPINIVLAVAAAVAVCVFCAGQRRKYMILLGLFVFGAAALSPALHGLRQDGVRVGTPMARGLFQKTLFRQWPLDAKSVDCDGVLIARATKPVNDYLEPMPQDLKDVLELSYSGFLRFRSIMPELMKERHSRRESDIDPVMMCQVRITFAQNPFYFLKDAFRQFWNFLAYNTYLSRQQRDRMTRYLEAHPPPPALLRQMGSPATLLPGARPALLALAFRVAQFGGAAAMLMGLVWLCVAPWARRSPDRRRDMEVMGIFGLVFFGELLATSAIEIAQPRYIYPLWSLTCVSLFLLFASNGHRLGAILARTNMRRWLANFPGTA